MKKIEGFWWPDYVGETWKHALRHVTSIEWALEHCWSYRTAVQAGGNIGLWPSRLATRFQRVLTFEPDAASRACLQVNVPLHVEIHREVLGDALGTCAIKHRGLGSHRVVDGQTCDVVPLDSFNLADVDLIQLDVEGYEWHALMGAEETVRASRPMIQVELRTFSEKYGHSSSVILDLLRSWTYVEVSRQSGPDVVFFPQERVG